MATVNTQELLLDFGSKQYYSTNKVNPVEFKKEFSFALHITNKTKGYRTSLATERHVFLGLQHHAG